VQPGDVSQMSAIYDHAGALKRMGNDEELFHEMVGLLKSDAPPLIVTAQSAARAGDAMQLQRAAHTLKGLASNFGGQRAVAAGAELEKLAKNRQSMGVPAALTELEEAFDELIGALAPAAEMSRTH
jgi:two-component system, sensor histidine kinase and response regulator